MTRNGVVVSRELPTYQGGVHSSDDITGNRTLISDKFFPERREGGHRTDSAMRLTQDLRLCPAGPPVLPPPHYVYDRIPSTSTIYNSDHVVTSGPM
jgi:hypothetical protein